MTLYPPPQKKESKIWHFRKNEWKVFLVRSSVDLTSVYVCVCVLEEDLISLHERTEHSAPFWRQWPHKFNVKISFSPQNNLTLIFELRPTGMKKKLLLVFWYFSPFGPFRCSTTWFQKKVGKLYKKIKNKTECDNLLALFDILYTQLHAVQRQ